MLRCPLIRLSVRGCRKIGDNLPEIAVDESAADNEDITADIVRFLPPFSTTSRLRGVPSPATDSTLMAVCLARAQEDDGPSAPSDASTSQMSAGRFMERSETVGADSESTMGGAPTVTGTGTVMTGEEAEEGREDARARVLANKRMLNVRDARSAGDAMSLWRVLWVLRREGGASDVSPRSLVRCMGSNSEQDVQAHAARDGAHDHSKQHAVRHFRLPRFRPDHWYAHQTLTTFRFRSGDQPRLVE